MKFGEFLSLSIITGWEPHYFDYWSLKEYIKRNTSEDTAGTKFDHAEFTRMFREEENRVTLFASGKLAEIANQLKILIPV